MIVFPMSGLSSRFSKAGYLSNKYKLDLYGNSVFHHIVSQFKNSDIKDRFVFIHNGNDFDENFIVQTCKNVGLRADEYFIVKLTGETRGQAETVFKGIDTLEIEDSERLIIYNIDSIRVKFDLPEEIDLLNVDGYLEVFEGNGDHWSFALPEDESSNEPFKKVIRVEEKNRISDYCSNGLYYFKSLDIFKEAYDEELKSFDEHRELFVAPLYNNLIQSKKSVYMRKIATDSTIFSGTPQEYEDITNLPIPAGIIPSEEYIANKIISYVTNGVSQKNYYKMMEILSYIGNISNLEKSSSIFSALNIFFSHYSSYARSLDYAFLHAYGPGKTKQFLDVYKMLQVKLVGFFKHTLLVQKNKSKALNLSCIIILIGNKDFIVHFQDEFKDLLHSIQITAQHSLFRIIRRNQLSGVNILTHCFSKFDGRESVSYLFMIFCAAYSHKNKSEYFSYIQEKLTTSYECEDDDALRKIILINFFSVNNNYNNITFNRDPVNRADSIDGIKKPVSENSSLEVLNDDIMLYRKAPIKVAVLISGQIRNCSYIAEFFKNVNLSGIEFDLYISTWLDTGSPPPHLNSLRGYEPKIRGLIKNRAVKFGVSPNDFANKYHLRKEISVDSHSLTEIFGDINWLNIDEEEVTTSKFESNQERMYYQISRAYKEASKKDYDVYIRTRPDVSFNLDVNDLKTMVTDCSNNSRLIYTKGVDLLNTYLPFIDDNFAICSPEAMKAYAGLYDILKDEKFTGLPLFNNGETIKQHSSLAYNLLLNNIELGSMDGNLTDWKFNDLGAISASEYVNYLKKLDKSNLNVKFIDSVIFKLRNI